jgi:RNA polymerase sigma factor (sigma-70 family)
MQQPFDDFDVRPIARWYAAQVIGRYGFVWDDIEDLIQSLLLEYQRRLSKYDPKRSGHQTWARLVMRHHLHSIIESRCAQRRDYRATTLLNDLGTQFSFNSHNSSDRDHMKIDVNRTLARLCPELDCIAQLLAASEPVTSIVKITGIPRATVYRRIEKIRRVLEAAGLRSYVKRSDTRGNPQTLILD